MASMANWEFDMRIARHVPDEARKIAFVNERRHLVLR